VQAVQFEQSVASILRKDARYDAQAYFFLKDALDFTLKRAADSHGGQIRHVSGAELLTGFRDFALEQFGPMASTLMHEWGVRNCRDVGEMVFLLIDGIAHTAVSSGDASEKSRSHDRQSSPTRVRSAFNG
jgi:uncharacterized repeat protein (TIGR04138 family)